MPTVDDILRAQRSPEIYDRLAAGETVAPSIYDRLAPATSNPYMQRQMAIARARMEGRRVPLAEIGGGFAEGLQEDFDNPDATRTVGVMDPANTDLRQGAREAGRIANPLSWLPGSPTAILKGLLAGGKGLNLAATVFHGSPHKFDAFDISKVGTGEAGGTSFGLGINLSKDPKHAAAYKGEGGHLYKVDLPDEKLPSFITWESPVSKDITDQLPPMDFSKPIPFGGGATIENIGGEWKLKSGDTAFRLSEKEVMRMFGGENTGEQVYRRLVASLGDERKASMWLKERGINGIANSTERGADNFVVFDDKLPKILSRE